MNEIVELKVKEKNKRRERCWCAITTKIFVGLCLYENYKLPKHYNNSKVFKALCVEADWIMDNDGNTYQKASLVIWTP
jgi:hypothetical protein